MVRRTDRAKFIGPCAGVPITESVKIYIDLWHMSSNHVEIYWAVYSSYLCCRCVDVFENFVTKSFPKRTTKVVLQKKLFSKFCNIHRKRLVSKSLDKVRGLHPYILQQYFIHTSAFRPTYSSISIFLNFLNKNFGLTLNLT